MVKISQVQETSGPSSQSDDPDDVELDGRIPRSKDGRPRLWLPDGSKRKLFSRPSGLGGDLEKKDALMSWGERMVLDGIHRAPELLEQYEKLTSQRNFDPKDQAFKRQINAITDRAKNLANAQSKADIGTQLHDITEAIDHGKDPGFIPPEFEPLVEAYTRAMDRARKDHGMQVLGTELFMVNDTWGVAGTLDKLLLWEDRLVIGDSKTSGTLEYSKGKFCIQLKAYAMGCRYDPLEAFSGISSSELGVGRRPYLDGVEMQQDFGIIIHFASDGTKCDIVKIPLEPALRGYQALQDLKEWRNFWGRKAQDLAPIISIDGSEEGS